jgi:hypothetical protein
VRDDVTQYEIIVSKNHDDTGDATGLSSGKPGVWAVDRIRKKANNLECRDPLANRRAGVSVGI